MSSLSSAPDKNLFSDSGYDYNTGGSNDFQSCNEGAILSSCDLYQFVEDPDRYIWAIQQDFTMIPGHNIDECDNDWRNEYTQDIKHRWDNGDPSGPLVTSHAPAGGKSGRISGVEVGIGTAGVNIGWTYYQPKVERMDTTVTDQARWEYDWEGDMLNTNEFRLGSECEFDSSVSIGDKLMDHWEEHTFRDNFGWDANSFTLWNEFHME